MYPEEVEDALDRWVQAKREKDYGTADGIRAELRSQGIEPDIARPLGGPRPGGGKGGNSARGLPGACPLGGGGAPAARYDPATEELLDQWVQAKRDRDYAMADMIREGLRAEGIDPDTARPLDKGNREPPKQQFCGTSEADLEVQLKLDEWVDAKRNRDFSRADEIRAELRAQGIEPDKARPVGKDRNILQLDTEAKLEAWVAAKRSRDFATADAIRDELRSRGVDPDTARPSERERDGHQRHNSSHRRPQGSHRSGRDRDRDRDRGRDRDRRDRDRSRGRSRGKHRHRDRGDDSEVEDLLERWDSAKRNEDYRKADAIRSQLRRMGVDPDSRRQRDGRGPSNRVGGPHMPGMMMNQVPMGMEMPMGMPMPMQQFAQSQEFSSEIDMQLDLWVRAKRDRDFAAADAIRDDLRAQGIDPESARPSEKNQGACAAMSQQGGAFGCGGCGGFGWGQAGMPMMQPMPMGCGQAMGMAGRTGPSTEQMLDKWVDAKRDRDYQLADEIRAELRSRGVSPSKARPDNRDRSRQDSGSGRSVVPVPAIDDDVEFQLDEWVQAKRDRDFAKADAIRAELRARGINPEQARPPEKESNGGMTANRPHVQTDRDTELQLDRWMRAKKERDFITADALRQALRQKGVDPDAARPSDRKFRAA